MSKQKTTCKGTKNDGSPCQVGRGLNDQGLCWRCASKQAAAPSDKPKEGRPAEKIPPKDPNPPKKESPVPPIDNKPRFDFSRKNDGTPAHRCPYCGHPNTKAVGKNKKGNVQYRECIQVIPICPGAPKTGSKRYAVVGKEIT